MGVDGRGEGLQVFQVACFTHHSPSRDPFLIQPFHINPKEEVQNILLTMTFPSSRVPFVEKPIE